MDLKRQYENRHDARRSTRNLCALINFGMFAVGAVIASALYYLGCDPSGGLITSIAVGWAVGVIPIAVGWYFYSLRKERVEERANNMKPVLSGSPADALMLSMHFTDPEARAAAVFEAALTKSQLNQWKKTERVTVPLSCGGAAIIGDGRVLWADGNNQCVGPKMHVHDWMPMGDILLCQLLYLRSDPNYVRSIGELSTIQRMSGRNPFSLGATIH